MDDTLLMNAGLSTTGVAILLIVYKLMKSIQGKKLISNCCGKKLEVGIDVQEMTPRQIVIDNPMKKDIPPILLG